MDLGDRMKGNYENRYRVYLTRRTPVIMRLDGKAFHTLTKGCHKPFDHDLHCCMRAAACAVLAEVQGAQCAYIQSDEVNILLTDYRRLDTEAWFDYNIQKIVSVAASICSVAFSLAYGKVGIFDCRAFNIPEKEVCNYFIWRQKDWERNSLFMLANSFLSAKELHKKKGKVVMKKSIKKKARIAFEADQEVTICFGNGEELTGLIISYASYEGDKITLRYKSPYVKHIPLDQITDIRFVGEERKVNPDIEIVKERLEHALAFGYPVSVIFKGCVSQGCVHRTDNLSFVMEKSVANGARHNYSAVISVELLKSKPEPHDIAFGRWEVGFGGQRLNSKNNAKYRYIHCGTMAGRVLFVVDEATDEETRIAAEAPELADMMRECINGLGGFMSQGGRKHMMPIILKLRALGVANVASWWKEDGKE